MRKIPYQPDSQYNPPTPIQWLVQLVAYGFVCVGSFVAFKIVIQALAQ